MTSIRIEHWIHQEVFTWQWWLLVLTWICAIAIWWRTAERKRLIELVLYGSLLAYLITVLDAIGSDLGLWGYGVKAIPVINRLMPVDCGVLSAIYMAAYQRLKTWKHFILGHLVVALVLAFVFEPIAMWSGVYFPIAWKSTYSYPIYVILPILMRLVVERLKSLQSDACAAQGLPGKSH